jgi:hypothetical protein
MQKSIAVSDTAAHLGAAALVLPQLEAGTATVTRMHAAASALSPDTVPCQLSEHLLIAAASHVHCCGSLLAVR